MSTMLDTERSVQPTDILPSENCETRESPASTAPPNTPPVGQLVARTVAQCFSAAAEAVRADAAEFARVNAALQEEAERLTHALDEGGAQWARLMEESTALAKRVHQTMHESRNMVRSFMGLNGNEAKHE